MNRTLHSSVSLLLAVTYLIVGLCGDSLHELPSAWQRAAQPVEESQYVYVAHAHSHGPDHHVHTHRYVIPRAEAPNRATVATRNEQSDGQPAVAGKVGVHSQHACPLLQLVATLKLSVCDLAVAYLPTDLVGDAFPASPGAVLAKKHFGRLPRGPPALATLAA